MVLGKDMRMLFLTVAAMVVSVAVVMNAYTKKHQFYPMMIYLTRSNRTMSILYIQAFLIGWQIVKFVKFLFFGSLRAIEVEHLIEKSWFAVIDTFILLAAFHEELSPLFVGMVSLLFAVKSFHWLINDRIDHMEQSPIITVKFHIRSVVLLLSLCAIDVLFVRRAWVNVKTKGMSVDIAFGLEYAIMLIEALNTLLRYILHSIDLRNENPWENKPIYIRYVNIVLGVFELVLYAGYMAFMLMIPFIPLHIARRVYRTARDFQRSIYEVVTSHQAIRNLNTLYPDATAEELQTANNVCIICREEMFQQCKKLPCNHIFHTNCLRSWFQRQHTCPTCRLDVLHVHRTRQQQQQQQQQQRNVNNQQPPAPAAHPPQMMFPPMMGWPPPHVPPAAAGAPPPPPAAGVPPSPDQEHRRQPTPTESEGQVRNDQNEALPINTPPANSFVPPPPAFPFVPPAPYGVPPPFMMPFPPQPMFGSPPPPPIVTSPPEGVFNGLTDEQLHQLEGMERSNVEARIQLLRNIQKLLDTAVLQMNQYSSLMGSLEYPPGPGFHGYQPPMPATGLNPVPSDQVDSIVTGDVNTPAEEGTPSVIQRSQSLGNQLHKTPPTTLGFDVKDLQTEGSNHNSLEKDGEGPPTAVTLGTKQPSVDLSEAELIRLRRLQRFHSVPVATTNTSTTVKEEEEDPPS